MPFQMSESMAFHRREVDIVALVNGGTKVLATLTPHIIAETLLKYSLGFVISHDDPGTNT